MYKSILFGLLAAVPTSTNFTLQTYDFGGGADAASSSNYNLQVSTGSPAEAMSSANYRLPAGIRSSASVAVPGAPTLTNPDDSYNSLKVILNNANMPADAKYIIAISNNDFATTQYVQSDQTISATADVNDYQTYAAWGGSTGFWILGLDEATTYKIRVAALQGPATGSAFGPEASAATVQPSVTFAVTTSLAGSPPFLVGFGSLAPGSVISGDGTINITVTTNAANGGDIIIRSQNAGLTSLIGSSTISSATTDLSSANTGYGAQVTGTSQSSGGPLAATSPFNGTGSDVGGLLTNWQQLASFGNNIANGTLTTTLKAKANASVASATDYTDTLNLAISLSF